MINYSGKGFWLTLSLFSISSILGFQAVNKNSNNEVLEQIVSKSQNIEQLDKYKQWINETIEESKQNKDYAMIIDKSEYSLDLYKDGLLIKSYNVELGRNPTDDKIQEGDGCTPEGKFYVAQKVPNSSFHKAFLLSYPNIEDAKRGLETELINQKEYSQIVNAINNKELPSQYTELGSWIEIHGSGSGKKGNNNGYNWTLGCISLSNENIDELYKIIKKKTPITVVKFGTKDYKN